MHELILSMQLSIAPDSMEITDPLQAVNKKSTFCFAFLVDSIAALISLILGKSSKLIKSLGNSVKSVLGNSGTLIP